MGKTPLFRSLGLCWVSLAVVVAATSGCTTTPTRGKLPPRGTITDQGNGFKQPPSSITNPGVGGTTKQPLEAFNSSGISSNKDQFPPPMPGTTVNTTNRPPASISQTGGFEQAPKSTLPGNNAAPFGGEPFNKTPGLGAVPPLPPSGGLGNPAPLGTDTGRPLNPFAAPLGTTAGTSGAPVLPPAPPPLLPGKEGIPGAAIGPLPPAPPLPGTNSTSSYTPGTTTTTTTAPPVGYPDAQPFTAPGTSVPLPPISGPQQ